MLDPHFNPVIRVRGLRTRGHAEPVETVIKALGHAGEYGAVWAGIGAVGASIDHRRRAGVRQRGPPGSSANNNNAPAGSPERRATTTGSWRSPVSAERSDARS